MEPYWPNKDVFAAGRHALPERKPSKELLGYLEKYQQDLLTTGTPEGLPNFAVQRNKLVDVMRQKYTAGQGYHQTISGLIVDVPKFWELVLSMDFVSHEIELVNNIGYDDREIAAGIRSTIEAPYAEFMIVGKDLKRAVAAQAEPAAPALPAPTKIVRVQQGGAPAEQSVKPRNVTVSITVEGAIYADFGNEKRLIKRARRDSAAYNFMNYMLGHQKQDVPRRVIQTTVDGCTGKKDMTELAKQCGFSTDLHPLKAVYFGGTTKTNVRFTATANLTAQQVKLLMQRDKLVV